MILKCGFDGHTYERPSQRGRPPKFCDLHKPKDDSVKITSHSAQNPAEKSKSIFDIVPGLEQLVQESNMRTLICEHGGHEWQQESRRGRKPRFCPEHTPQFSSPSNSLSTATPTKHMSEVIQSILKSPTARSCSCGLSEMSTAAEIRAMGGGCTMPQFVCPNLDGIRRTLNL